jgi:tripeptide aminopeptidase
MILLRSRLRRLGATPLCAARARRALLGAAIAGLLSPHPALPASPAYQVSAQVQAAYRALESHPQFRQGLAFLERDQADTVADQQTIAAIPAPPFKEKARGQYIMNRLADLGLSSVSMDAEGNACGARPGHGGGPRVLLEAHLDTVFPEGTDVVPRAREGKLYAPGIADNSRGLAALLSVLRALNATRMRTIGDIVFCGTVGEEGLGDLRGMKAFFKRNRDVAASVSVDGTNANGITYLATGSRRYEVSYIGPGGHSFGAFGTPSAIHAMGRAIAKIAELQTVRSPRTTFTVGTVSGGTSVNAIAANATMLIDLRSNDQKELERLVARLLPILHQAADEENARWKSDWIQVAVKVVGDRPAGSQPAEASIVQAAWLATKAIGRQPQLAEASSTNANLPISLGIPAITIGGGGADGRNHSLDEWFDPKDAYLGPQKIFATVLGLVGVEGGTQSILPASGAVKGQ